MANKVGAKGQIVVEKQIRDRLGVEPGWLALQRLVDDHLEVYFVPPEHTRSLKGSLKAYVTTHISPDDWHDAKERAWAIAAWEKELPWLPKTKS